MAYQVDRRDIDFQLFEWLPIGELLGAERFADWDEESLRMVLGEALKIAQNEFDPANEIGDREGSRWQDGEVTVPSPETATGVERSKSHQCRHGETALVTA